MNGNLYMMKVTPKNMPSYYLIKHDPNGEWVREDTEGKAISLPMWVIRRILKIIYGGLYIS
jgi:hypothetical protein